MHQILRRNVYQKAAKVDISSATRHACWNEAAIRARTSAGLATTRAGGRGSGNAASTDFVNTGWATNLSGSWIISLWLTQPTATSTLLYFFGDSTAGNFRAFTNGLADTNTIILRGGFTDVLITDVWSAGSGVVHFVYDSAAGLITGYKNGQLTTVTQSTTPTISGAEPFKVAGYSSTVGLQAGQVLDEFRMYNRALSADEITATWNRTLPLRDMSISKTVQPAIAEPGDAIVYTINYANTDATILNNIVITDTVGSYLTDVDYTASGVALTRSSGTTYVWTAPSLPVGASGTGTLTTPLASGVYTNTVTITSADLICTAAVPLTVANVALVGNAGADQAVRDAQVVTLDGSASSDRNGDTLTYLWTQTSGPAVTLSSASTVNPTFTAPATDAVLTFALTTTDSQGRADATPDHVVVTVTKPVAGYSSSPAVASPIAIGTVVVGASSTATLTISETGSAPLQITAVTILGPQASNFSVTPRAFTIMDGGPSDHNSVHAKRSWHANGDLTGATYCQCHAGGVSTELHWSKSHLPAITNGGLTDAVPKGAHHATVVCASVSMRHGTGWTNSTRSPATAAPARARIADQDP